MKIYTKLKLFIVKVMSRLTIGKPHEFFENRKKQLKFVLTNGSKNTDQTEEMPEEMNYEKNRKKGDWLKNNYDFDTALGSLLDYSMLNKIKELELKRKIEAGKTVRVLFLLDQSSKFSAHSVYHVMKSTTLFEPFIVLYDSSDGLFFAREEIYSRHIDDLKLLEKRGYEIFDGYDENRFPIPVNNFKPDIIFFTAPYLDYHDTFLSTLFLNVNYLTCYMSYSFVTINNYDYIYNNRRIDSCWKNFLFTKDDLYEVLKYSKYGGVNAVLCGYPKLDAFAKKIEDCKIPKKIDNGNPIVIYAPHHSIKNSWTPTNLSTFHLYHKFFLELVKTNSNINFVFKPHPELIKRVVTSNTMTSGEYNQYLSEWDNLPNGLVVTDGEYIDLFRKSELLITDCGSFIGEWLPTEKPCMYLVNPERNQKYYMDGFSTNGRKILEKYYLCHNLEEIEQNFNMIMFEHKDPMKKERIKLIDEIFVNVGCAGQKIVDYMTDVLTN